MEKLYEEHHDLIEFFVVSIQEAHPTYGWQTDNNVADEVLLRQHQDIHEREEAPRFAA